MRRCSRPPSGAVHNETARQGGGARSRGACCWWRTPAELAVEVARDAHRLLTDAGMRVRCWRRGRGDCELDPVEIVDDHEKAALDVELIMVLGGDGSMLRGAELARPHGTPMLGRESRSRRVPGRGRAGRPGRIVERVVDRSYRSRSG